MHMHQSCWTPATSRVVINIVPCPYKAVRPYCYAMAWELSWVHHDQLSRARAQRNGPCTFHTSVTSHCVCARHSFSWTRTSRGVNTHHPCYSWRVGTAPDGAACCALGTPVPSSSCSPGNRCLRCGKPIICTMPPRLFNFSKSTLLVSILSGSASVGRGTRAFLGRPN